MSIFAPKSKKEIDDNLSMLTNKELIWLLFKAIAYNSISEIKYLYKDEFIEARNIIGWTPLIVAAENDNMNLVNFFLNKGADVNAESRSGWTTLLSAVSLYNLKMTRLLLDKGANPNVVNIYGTTPLSIAINHRYRNIVKLLKKYGAKE